MRNKYVKILGYNTEQVGRNKIHKGALPPLVTDNLKN